MNTVLIILFHIHYDVSIQKHNIQLLHNGSKWTECLFVLRNEEKDEKTDTRVQFTQHKLREAILELLQEKSIDSISVKEICEEAGLKGEAS